MVVSFGEIWPYLVALVSFTLSAVVSGHVVIYKRDARAAIAWVGIIWLSPFVGTLLYILFGMNRIRRRAHSLRTGQPVLNAAPDMSACTPAVWAQLAEQGCGHLTPLVKLVHDVTQKPLLGGNQVQPLVDGDEAFPAMLEAIDQATCSVSLSTYIFDHDQVGHKFAETLARAVERGVEVRVLIDDVGSRYSWPRIAGRLRRQHVRTATFNPTLVPRRFRYSNLRNHRKILVVDGRIGFTGSINIRESSLVSRQTAHAVRDVHFRIGGPVVASLQQTFAVDWSFSTGELLAGEPWFPQLEAAGPTLARGISDGPDEDLDKLRMTILGAISCAQSSLSIVTPYFLPDNAVITALKIAAMRGVEVDIVIPKKNNLLLVQWASMAQLWQILERGCRVWLSPPPFDHTKLMIVDGIWALLGSSNWDPRSLRLNFEFNVECYDPALSATLNELVHARVAAAEPVTLEGVEGRRLAVRLRDGIARLASPFL